MFKLSNRVRFYYKTFYQLLEVPQNASQTLIKQNYLRIVKLYHPDTNSQQSQNQEYFKQVTAAYKILSNETERQKYDQSLSNTNQSSQQSENTYQHSQQTQKSSQQSKQSSNQQSKNYSQYQNQTQSKEEQENFINSKYSNFILFLFFTWLSQQFKKKEPVDVKQSNSNPNIYVQNEKKQLSEEDCKNLSISFIKEKSKQGDYIMGQLCYDRLFQDERKQLNKKKNLEEDDYLLKRLNINNTTELQLKSQIQQEEIKKVQINQEQNQQGQFSLNQEIKQTFQDIEVKTDIKQNEQELQENQHEQLTLQSQVTDLKQNELIINENQYQQQLILQSQEINQNIIEDKNEQEILKQEEQQLQFLNQEQEQELKE
ncbi:unnamed protein product [Paramecium sonneborni]|uniref:J domain-containing protein n=1 Tax=Paramecium sonneborni TaxID=65129 RepID=A0A8S1RJ01_9CILI|nr:unnamed protein product [Paramecium sonneborni]